MTEADIIEGCRKGNESACRALVDSYSAYVYSICRRYVKDEFLAKDCMQESFIQIIKKIDRYEERGKLKSWICAVTIKKCLDILRKEKRHLSSDLDNVPEPYKDENISHKLNVQDVMCFLNELPSHYRVAINMFVVEGYSHKEISDKLSISEGSSRSLVSRARKMIKERFEKENIKVEDHLKCQNKCMDYGTNMVSINLD